MGPFRFRLANVLAIWQRREETALAVLHRESALSAIARGEVERLQRLRAEASDTSRAALADPRAWPDPSWHRNWITHLKTQLTTATQEVVRCDAREAAARAVWQRAQRDRRVIERLRDRAGRRHAAEVRRVERVAMDERAGLMAQKERAW